MKPDQSDPVYRRACEIHAEGRKDFHFGPAPYSNYLSISHSTGPKWNLYISDYLTEGGIDHLVNAVKILAELKDAEAMAQGLAYLEACNEDVHAGFALSPVVEGA